METSKRNKNPKFILIATSITILITAMVVVIGMMRYWVKMSNLGLENIEIDTKYEKHYAFIIEDEESHFWENVYEGAKEKGSQLGIYVEKFGETLPVKYTITELLKSAIISNVDGIIMQANNDEEIQALINQAQMVGISVVTVLEDSSQSNRICFVGVNNYQLGKKYGQQILEIANKQPQKVRVLLDTNKSDTSPDIILSGINDMLVDSDIDVSVTTIDRKTAFSSEEAIHDIMLASENVPDILICLNLTDTICAYQTAVDYNKVGKIKIIGYHNSQNISQAIEKQIIHSTIVIDAKGMGAHAVAALNEYANTKRVSEYISVDMTLVSLRNIGGE